MRIVFLCDPDELTRERRGYQRALQALGVEVDCHGASAARQGSLAAFVAGLPEPPVLLLHPDTPFLPEGLREVEVPSACFHIDTDVVTHHRAYWSRLFDIALCFEPGFEAAFERAGQRNVRTFAHAVEAELFQPREARDIEVGWAARVDSSVYGRRRAALGLLLAGFRMNQPRAYGFEEMAELFARSRVVVNLLRDDQKRGPNLRCFEAMAAGAALVTDAVPGLESIGLRQDVHFVGCREVAQLPRVVRDLLQDDERRRRIASAGHAEVLARHTYAARAGALLELLHDDGWKMSRPARALPPAATAAIYCHYFAKHGLTQQSLAAFRVLAKSDALGAARALPSLARALLREAGRWSRQLRSSSGR